MKYSARLLAASALIAAPLLTTAKTMPLTEASLEGDERIQTPIGEITLEHNYITDDMSQALFDELDYQRAVQLYIWSTPLVSFYQWMNEQVKVYGGGEPHEFTVFESLKEKRGIVTANLTTPYILSWGSLADGPIYVELPVGQTAGGALDMWQRPITDFGLTGPDQCKGGRFIIVGPEDDIKKYLDDSDKSLHVFQSETNNLFFGIRLLDDSPEFAKTFKKNFKLGSSWKKMKSAKFIEGKNKEWSATAPRGIEYWKVLHQAINAEPVRTIDKPWMAMLKPLGIEKGESFKPNERQLGILKQGVMMGELMLRNLQTNPRFVEPYWAKTSWYKSFDFDIPQENDIMQQLDERGVWFYEAVTSTKGMVNPTEGKGQVYMTSKRDSEGRLLRADKTYKLTVPANVPVKQFWALTLYSENTRRPYDNGGKDVRSANLSSKDEGLQVNKDGSVDLYIGAKAPKGMESNFVKTVDQDGWFVYFRLYGPLKAFFDKSWGLPDFEEVTI